MHLKIAAVVTEYRPNSHAQHIIDCLLWGYGWHGKYRRPDLEVVSLYTDQVPESDLSRERAALFPSMRIYPTVQEALTLGGDKLAVDGVLLIAEHGRYAKNEKQQTLYPRYEFFREIVDVFDASDRCVPVFNDKHLSWKWEWAKEMVETAREMDFPLMAGSSVPWTYRLPALDVPWGAQVEEALCLSPGGIDGYDIHALEALQCMVERRLGGETGVVTMHALSDDAVWKALAKGSWEAGGWDRRLFEACLCRSHTLALVRDMRENILFDFERIPSLVEKPVAYRFEYANGLKATILLVEGLIQDFTFAARLNGQEEPLSTLMYLPPGGNFFIPFCRAIEETFLTGKAKSPVERTLLTTGLTAAGIESIYQGEKRIETPHLSVQYSASRESLFCNHHNC